MVSGLGYFSGLDPLCTEARKQLMPDALPARVLPDKENALPVKAAVVCVHGFTAMPYEVMPVARACGELGIAAIAPLLPGHGYRDLAEQKQQFGKVTKAGLLSAVRTEIARVRDQYEWVGIYGHSMGGAIALILSAEGLVDACAVSAPAIKLPRIAEWLAPVICCVGFTRNAPTCKTSFHLPCYQFHHSYAVRALWRLSRSARQQLSQITCPVLGVHTHDDKTVPPIVLDLMQQQIPVPVETAWFDPSSHVMTLDVSGEQVSEAIAQFFQRQLISSTHEPSSLLSQSHQ